MQIEDGGRCAVEADKPLGDCGHLRAALNPAVVFFQATDGNEPQLQYVAQQQEYLDAGGDFPADG